jgi:predicted ArsR family transcriptional regulator
VDRRRDPSHPASIPERRHDPLAERRHDLLAEVLIDGVLAESDTRPAREVAVDIAYERGTRLGAAERDRVQPGRLGAEPELTLLTKVLARHGFEPDRDGPTCLRLRNCPFQPLARRASTSSARSITRC